jgi:hypothetical protein
MASTSLRVRELRVDWQELTDLTRGQPFVVERVRLADSGVVVEGQFEPPQLAQLSIDDQVFVAAFVRSHGSIKEMERIFGVSYPTIKSRLNRIAVLRVSPAGALRGTGQLLWALPGTRIEVEEGRTALLVSVR